MRACVRACVHVGVCKCIRGVCAYVRVLVFACIRVRACVVCARELTCDGLQFYRYRWLFFLNSTSKEINLEFLQSVHAISSASFSCNVAIVGADRSRQL